MSAKRDADGHLMNTKLGAIAMLLSATGMGLVGTLSRMTTAGLSPDDKSVIGSFLAFGRMTTGFIGFIIIAFLLKRLGDVLKTRQSFSVIMGGVCIGLSLGFYISSTLMTTIANAVFLIYTGPLFCTILARIFRKERISPLSAVFLVMVFIGMLFTIGVIDYKEGAVTFGLSLESATEEFPNKALGDILGLLSGVFYGLAMFFYGYRKDIDSVVRGAWNFLWAAVATLIMSLILNPWHGVSTFTGTQWGWAATLFLVCGLFALGFLVVAGRNLPAVEYSTISYWECPVAIVCGLLFFGESLTFIGLFGGLLIIVGGLAPIFLDRKKEQEEEATQMHDLELEPIK